MGLEPVAGKAQLPEARVTWGLRSRGSRWSLTVLQRLESAEPRRLPIARAFQSDNTLSIPRAVETHFIAHSEPTVSPGVSFPVMNEVWLVYGVVDVVASRRNLCI